MGTEYNISFNSNVDYIDFHLILSSLDYIYTSTIKLDITNNKLQLQDFDEHWHDIATSLKLLTNDYIFHSLKLVCDFVNKNYVYLIFDGISYNITEHLLRYDETSFNPFLECRIDLFSEGGVNGIAYLDSVIITRNEP